MKLLIKCELLKLLRRKYLLVGGLILLTYTLFLFYSYGMNSGPTFPVHTTDGTLVEGRDAVLYNKTIYAQYAGELTDATVAKVLDDFYAAREEYESNMQSYEHPRIYGDFALFRTNNTANADKELSEYGYVSLASTDIPVFETPLYFAFPYTWQTAANIFHNANIAFAIFLLITLAPLFAEEYSSGADGIILTTRYGKSKVVHAKIIATLLTATIGVIVFSLFILLLCGLYFDGFTGWQADMQTQFDSLLMSVPIRMNNLQFFLFSAAMYWLAAMGIAALTCCCSALCKKPFSALIASGVIYMLPFFPRQISFGGEKVSNSMLVFPVWTAKAQQVLRILSRDVSNELLLVWIIVFTGLSAAVLFCITYKRFSQKQVTN